MIITDYNKMSISELEVISATLEKEYTIEDGRITEVLDANEKEN